MALKLVRLLTDHLLLFIPLHLLLSPPTVVSPLTRAPFFLPSLAITNYQLAVLPTVCVPLAMFDLVCLLEVINMREAELAKAAAAREKAKADAEAAEAAMSKTNANNNVTNASFTLGDSAKGAKLFQVSCDHVRKQQDPTR